MSLEKILKKHLPKELFTQVVDELGDDFDFDYVPRSRLNAVIKQRNDLRQRVADVDDLDDDGDEGDDGATNPPKKKAAKKQTEPKGDEVDVEALKAQHQAELEAVKIEFALTDALRSEGCNNPKLLMPQLDMSKIKFGEDGKLEGHTEQLTAWKTSDPYLFSTSASGEEGGDGTGAEGIGDTGKGKSKKTAIDKELEAIFGAEE